MEIKDIVVAVAAFLAAKTFGRFEKTTSETGALRERIGQLEQQNKAAFREIDLLRGDLHELRQSRKGA